MDKLDSKKKEIKVCYSLICCNICQKEIKHKIIVECKYHYCDSCIFHILEKFNKYTS